MTRAGRSARSFAVLVALVVVVGACKKEPAAGEAPPGSEGPVGTSPTTDPMSGYERAKVLLDAPGRSIELVKLALKPEQLAATGASDFHAFATTRPQVLLYVFEYADPRKALAGEPLLVDFAAENEIVFHGGTAVNGNLVLLAGTDASVPPTPPQVALSVSYRQAFVEAK